MFIVFTKNYNFNIYIKRGLERIEKKAFKV